ncbi:phage tail protein [Macrococcus animalis]|uniref:phage tail protein n=1 Tax=Macrococcus animalis TaxID=3395467 RepID=UPI0039BE7B4B
MDMAEFVAKIMADIDAFERDIKKAMAMAKSLDDNVTVDIEASINDFRRDLLKAEALAKRFEADDIEKEVELKTNKFMAAWRQIQSANDKFSGDMDELANSIRSFGTVGANVIKGGLLSSFTALIPIVASLVPVVMAVGNALAVVGGGAIGLMGAFAILQTGVYAFGFMATTAIKMLKDGLIQASSATVAYQSALDGLKSKWQEIVTMNADGIFTTMANGMNAAKVALEGLTPFLSGVVTTMQKASAEMLKWAQTSSTAQKFFEMMGTTGVTVFENVIGAIGRFGNGFLNLINQLAPLFEWVGKGLLNMGTQFDQWSQKVSTAEGIKNFIAYVQENLPKLGEIFGNTFEGIFNLFKAFAPNSQTIFDSLVIMSAKFAEWSATIAASDGFQKFIEYVQTNGPTIMGLIGSIVMAIVNFGIAVAPLGQAVLQIVTAFTQWIAKMFETHPIIAQIMAVMVTLLGVGMQLAPVIMFLVRTFQMLILPLMNLMNIGGLVMNVLRLLAVAFTGISWPVLAVIAVVGALIAVFVHLWQTNDAFRISLIAAWEFIKSFFITAVELIKSTLINGFTNMLTTGLTLFLSLQSGLSSAWESIKSAFSTGVNAALQFLTTGFSNMLSAAISWASEFISNAITTMSNFASEIMNGGAQALSSLSDALSNMISAVVDWGSQMISNAVSAMSNFVSEIVSGGSEAVSAISSACSEMVSTAIGFVGDMANAGVQLIAGMIQGIKDKAGDLVSAAGDAVGNAINAAKSKLGIASPSKVFREIGAFTSEGMAIGITDNARMAVASVTEMAKEMIDAYNPDFASVNASMNKDLGSLNKDLRNTVDADISSGVDVARPIVNVAVHNEGDAEMIRSYVNTEDAIAESLAF